MARQELVAMPQSNNNHNTNDNSTKNNNKQSEMRVASCAAQVMTKDDPTDKDKHEPTKDEHTNGNRR